MSVRQVLLERARSQQIAPNVFALIEENLNVARPLTLIEKQQRFIIETHLMSPECPWCDSVVSFFEAIPEDYNYRLGYGCDCTRCPHCQKQIVEAISFIGSHWYWRKREEDKNPQRHQRGKAK